MMTKYFCDTCEKEVGTLYVVSVEGEEWNSVGVYRKDLVNIDVCSSCRDKIAEAIKEIHSNNLEGL